MTEEADGKMGATGRQLLKLAEAVGGLVTDLKMASGTDLEDLIDRCRELWPVHAWILVQQRKLRQRASGVREESIVRGGRPDGAGESAHDVEGGLPLAPQLTSALELLEEQVAHLDAEGMVWGLARGRLEERGDARSRELRLAEGKASLAAFIGECERLQAKIADLLRQGRESSTPLTPGLAAALDEEYRTLLRKFYGFKAR